MVVERKKFSLHTYPCYGQIEVDVWFYEVMNSIYKHDKPSRESEEIYQEDYMEKTDTDMGLWFVPFEYDSTKIY